MLKNIKNKLVLVGLIVASISSTYSEELNSNEAHQAPKDSSERTKPSPKFNPENYTLQANDIIRIQMLYDSLVNTITPVGQDGTISVPFAGTISVAGKTTLELEKILKQIFIEKLRLRDPKVSVTLEQFRKIRASIVGAVGIPGTYNFLPQDTLLTLISTGGGPLPNGQSDMKHAVLRRRNSPEAITIDLHTLLNKTTTVQNYPLKDGDELYVPEGIRNNVMVVGALTGQGSFPYTDNMRVMTAISLAGGKVENVSMLSKTMVIREKEGKSGEYEHIPVNLISFIKKGDSSQNIALKPGDIVYVPQSNSLFSPATGTFLGSISSLLYTILNVRNIIP